MDKFIIMGGKRLSGEVTISGAKNAAVAIIPAALLVDGICVIENVPSIKDVEVIVDLLRYLGAKVTYLDDTTLEIDTKNVKSCSVPEELAQKMRASYYLLGALLGRFNKADVPLPGGCNFGTRPIDQHIKGFEAMGADVEISHGRIKAEVSDFHSAQVFLDVVSVGATINIMIAAALAEGTTTIENAAKEPHVVDVANFLNAAGANVRGAGTDVIKIKGVNKMCGGNYSIIPDQIEAGTFMIAAAATQGDVLVKNVIPKHMDSVSAKLIEMNATVEEFDESIRVIGNSKIKKANIKTLPYPGFPTDLQPQIASLLSIADGTSMITESVWDNRFQYVDELIKLGAKITVDGKIAIIEGVDHLNGAKVRATDLRAGAGMVIAALMAHGVTEISELIHIDRGYDNFENKLKALGAQIIRKSSDNDDDSPEVING